MKVKFEGQIEYLEFNEEQLEAVSSVACDEVFSAMSAMEARSVREIADEIGKSPAAVSEQIAKLVRVGLVLQVGTRKRRSRTEALYAGASLIDKIRLPKHPKRFLELMLKRFEAQMRRLARQFGAANIALCQDRSFSAFMMAHTYIAHLSPESSLVVKQKVNELLDLVGQLDEHDPDMRRVGGHVRVNLGIQMLPTVAESNKVIDEE